MLLGSVSIRDDCFKPSAVRSRNNDGNPRSDSSVWVNPLGLVDPDGLRRAITSQTALVNIMHANNGTGTIQPIAECTSLAHEHGIPFRTDAAQSAGKIPTQVDARIPRLSMASEADLHFDDPQRSDETSRKCANGLTAPAQAPSYHSQPRRPRGRSTLRLRASVQGETSVTRSPPPCWCFSYGSANVPATAEGRRRGARHKQDGAEPFAARS
ncbi:MAG: aminotransferase class V-fold PLP-dependent enzyme [Allorhizobium sp.]